MNLNDAMQEKNNKLEELSQRLYCDKENQFKECYSLEEFCETVNIMNEEIIKKWNSVLREYAYQEKEDVVFPIRCRNSAKESKIESKEKKYKDELRRGFYTHIKNGFDYFFADNDLACLFCNAVLNEYDIKVDDLNTFFHNPESKIKFTQNTKEENKKSFFNLKDKASNPGFGKKQLKLSHIISVGEDYYYNDMNFNIRDICDYFFRAGSYGKFKKNEIREEELEDKEIAIKFARAIFFRFLSPMNYILTPNKSHHFMNKVVYKNEIGESLELRNFMVNYYKSKYKNEYEEFLNLAMYNDDIKIFLGSTISDNTESKKFVSTIKRLFADDVLNDELIKKLSDKNYSKNYFGLEYPALIDIENKYDSKRYYRDVFDFHGKKYKFCSQWYTGKKRDGKKYKNNMKKKFVLWIKMNIKNPYKYIIEN